MNLYPIKTKIRRWLNSKLSFSRPSNYPYISGDSFRALSQHVLDEISSFNPIYVKENDIVFIRGNHIDEFINGYLERIQFPFILITHNDDTSIEERHLQIADNKYVIHWFAENLNVEHAKITPIPIGIGSIFYEPRQEVVTFSNLPVEEKQNRIYYSFKTETNKKVRGSVLKILKGCELADGPNERISKEEYLKHSSIYKIIASPPGNGPDCHRTWEALYLKSIPLVQRSVATTYWKSIGLPLILIDEWENILAWDETTIANQYDSLKERLNHPALYMPYWTTLINEHRI